MIPPRRRRPLGLVVDADDARTRDYAETLARCGLDPLCFASCAEALLWLEEDTPAAAVIGAEDDPALQTMLSALAERGVVLVGPKRVLQAAE